jgi:hypothetical protein
MFLMQLYQNVAKTPHMPQLLPLMVRAVSLQGPGLAQFTGNQQQQQQQQQQGGAAGSGNQAEAGAGPGAAAVDLKKVPEAVLVAVSDMKTAQIKTLNFLTVMMRNYADQLEPHQPTIISAMFYLFRCVAGVWCQGAAMLHCLYVYLLV